MNLSTYTINCVCLAFSLNEIVITNNLYYINNDGKGNITLVNVVCLVLFKLQFIKSTLF